MNAFTYRTASEDETIDLGRSIGRRIRRPVLILLKGNLGAGKTTMTKGIVDGLGAAVPEEVSSPTYTLVHDYGSGVFHIDLYRLESTSEVASLGVEEILDREDAVVLVEWGERFPELWPPDRRIDIDIRADGDAREFRVAFSGNFAPDQSIQPPDPSSGPRGYTE